MKKPFLIISVFAVVLVVGVFALSGFLSHEERAEGPVDTPAPAEPKGDIVVHEPEPSAVMTTRLTVRGEARGTWFYEGDFPVRLLDGNGEVLVESYASAVLDTDDPESTWMTQDYVPFEAELAFPASTTPEGTLVLEKDDPSGLAERAAEMRIPVRFAMTEAPQRTVKLYYYDPARDTDASGNIICSDAGLVAVERDIPATLTPIQDAVGLLLRGELTEEELDRGITTEFPLEGLALDGAAYANGVLTLGFTDPDHATSGGSCRVGILWFQIRETAKQFEGVEEVRFQPEELFQP